MFSSGFPVVFLVLRTFANSKVVSFILAYWMFFFHLRCSDFQGFSKLFSIGGLVIPRPPWDLTLSHSGGSIYETRNS